MKFRIFGVLIWFLMANTLVAQTGAFKTKAFKSPETKFNWDNLVSLTASGDGVGGVLFLQDNQGKKIVVKYEGDDAAAIVYSDFVMTELKIPNSNSTLLPRNGERNSPKDSITFVDVTDKIAVLANAETSKNNARLQSVFMRFETAAGVLIMRNVAGTGECWTVEQIIRGASENTANSQKRAGLLIKALNDKNQAKTLGRLFAADTILGNGDRFQQDYFNAGNLMLDSKAKFIAIDNFSDMSSMEEVGYWMAVKKHEDYAGPVPKTTRQEIDLHTKDWIRMLVHGFRRDGIRTPSLIQVIDVDKSTVQFTSVIKQQVETMLSSFLEKDASKRNRKWQVKWNDFEKNFKTGLLEARGKFSSSSKRLKSGLTKDGEKVLDLKLSFLNECKPSFDEAERIAALKKITPTITKKQNFNFELNINRGDDGANYFRKSAPNPG